MARPREFDEGVVIEAARSCFWTHGVNATSISDLSEATGLSVGSIYKAFGSKDGLHRATLDTYLDTAVDAVAEVLTSGETPVTGIEAWLEDAAARAADEGPTRGCYAVNCATELAERDPSVRDRLRRHDSALRATLTDTIRAGVRSGELSCDPEAGARLLLTTVNGLQVDARKGVDLDDARSTLRLALEALR